MVEVSEATLARWRSKCGGMKSEEAKRLKDLEGENAQFETAAGAELDKAMLKEALGKRLSPTQKRQTVKRLRDNGV